MPENPSTSAPAAPVISSRILGLKFMQKHRASKGEPAAPPEPSLSSSAKWRLDLPGGLAVAPAAVVLTEPPALSGPQALLQFRAGRRSYGAFNPKLEARLADLGEKKRAAAAELEAAAAAATQRAQQEAAAAELQAERDAEAAERDEADAEMAARYRKYVPAGGVGGAGPASLSSLAPDLPPKEPPEVSRPVLVTDAPLGAGRGGGKRKAEGGGGGRKGGPSSAKERRR